MIRVLICDDQAIVCDGLEAILSTDSEIEVVGLAANGAQAVEIAQNTKPDLVLMDLKMPGMNGIQATQAIRERLPETRVLVLTTYDDDEWVFDAIRSGAAGYMLKDTPRDKLIPAIKDTVAGKTHVDPVVAGKLFKHIAQETVGQPTSLLAAELSDREREVLQLITHGLSNTEIAQQLHLSDGTVRNYVSALFVKLGVSDRTQAAVLALRYGLVG
jgi:two-component system, NarL family, response regulator LiaR